MSTAKIIAITTATIFSWHGANAVFAADNNNYPGSYQISPNEAAAATRWFANFDRQVATYQITPGDIAVLARPINKQKDRFDQWAATAGKVAHNYRTLAKAISALPAVNPEIKQYRDLTCDWYNDSAFIYEDLLRPKPPAQTVEELQQDLDQIKQQSNNLAESKGSLQNMDRALRNKYLIHAN